MLNAERFKEEINKRNNVFGLTDSIADCRLVKCRDCRFSHLNNSDDGIIMCSTRKVKWLLSEYREPVKLSKLEYELLKFFKNEGYKYIARDNVGETLYRYPEKPTKNIYDEWGKGGICTDLRMFNDLFQFVKWGDEEPTSIKDVLDNCEVFNDVEE